ncbi:Na+/H+ antiporter NhaA [Paractinoplanes brasiliensis]|uniref:Na(+)/H(+) antiporter NhaA n=1 Tax=Paractinoplanes brasiliensis TaxID=52695 RepID=A0A4V3C8K8_9ACTN|nr:Na+/H+ antiporter NhaA [Actinoplanes brasiliensis]TDO41988.1 sodium/proton antiporter (NhaA family) [Actinoplanes brasiliensis]GID29731.1 Na(+)/H(+) antiporter NhaA 2 [Actinoplanes brasiliensis]
MSVAGIVRRISEGGQLPRTDRTLRLDHRVRTILVTETRGAAALLAATVLALVWANLPGGSYEAMWGTEFTIGFGDAHLAEDLRHWVNDGLMVFFFLLAGMEIRRELSFGDLRDRRAALVPILAAGGGMVVPAVVFAVITVGTPAQHAWGMAMATDIAFALGVLAVIGPRCPANVRVFLLTLAVVDDIGAILVIAVVYTESLHLAPLLAAAALLGVVLAMRAAGIWRATPYFVVGVALWVATVESGLHPTIVGVAFGLLTPAFLARTADLDRLERILRKFRREPGPEAARTLSIAAQGAVSSNDRLQYLLRPWSSLLIVPLFALANAGVVLSPEVLSRAVTSPVTLGVFAGLVVGKTLGIWGTSALAVRTGLGRLPSGVRLPQVLSVGAVAGIGFTVSLFIAELALTDEQVRDEAKIGILAAAVAATGLGWLLFRLTGRRTAPDETTLLQPAVEASGEHHRGPLDAPVELVQFGDYECPYCRQAAPVIAGLLTRHPARLRYVWRHLPLDDIHPYARRAAQAAEAAAAQDNFWTVHDRLLAADDLDEGALAEIARSAGLDVSRFLVDLDTAVIAAQVEADVRSAHDSGAEGTPTFFLNGARVDGTLDEVSAAVERALEVVAS